MAMDDSQATDWATVQTNAATNDTGGAWAAALSGLALGVYVDRTLNASQSINSSQGYGVNPDGSYYRLGQTTYQGQGVQAPRNNNLLLLLLVGAVIMMSK